MGEGEVAGGAGRGSSIHLFLKVAEAGRNLEMSPRIIYPHILQGNLCQHCPGAGGGKSHSPANQHKAIPR